MDTKKRCMFLSVFTLSCIAVGLLSASLATNNWVLSTPKRNVSKDIEDGALNVTGGDIGTKFKGKISFGLFRGYKELDHGLGVRSGPIEIKCSTAWNKCAWVSTAKRKDGYIDDIMEKYEAAVEAAEKANSTATSSTSTPHHGLFSMALWVVAVICVCVGLAWGLVSMAFSMLNVCTRPIDTITGPIGLYVWNICALIFCLLCLAVYLSLFFLDYQRNVLSPEDRDVYNWYSEDLARLDYSFYLVVVASALYLINIIVVALSGTSCHWIHYGNNINEKSMEGVMMY